MVAQRHCWSSDPRGSPESSKLGAAGAGGSQVLKVKLIVARKTDGRWPLSNLFLVLVSMGELYDDQ